MMMTFSFPHSGISGLDWTDMVWVFLTAWVAFSLPSSVSGISLLSSACILGLLCLSVVLLPFSLSLLFLSVYLPLPTYQSSRIMGNFQCIHYFSVIIGVAGALHSVHFLLSSLFSLSSLLPYLGFGDLLFPVLICPSPFWKFKPKRVSYLSGRQ